MRDEYFNPRQFIALAATTTAASGNITQPDLTDVTTGQPLVDARIYNSGTSVVFVAFGGSGVAATSTTGVPVPPNFPEKFNMGRGAKGVSAIAAAGSANVYVQIG